MTPKNTAVVLTRSLGHYAAVSSNTHSVVTEFRALSAQTSVERVSVSESRNEITVLSRNKEFGV